ncbi:MAG: hypothetical protein JRD89_04800 [Deltaproteobacteria bacterium]|nr:hypothetical protein [Deltaproteobacteria bacterium]
MAVKLLDFVKKPDESFGLVEGKEFSVFCGFKREPEKEPKVVCLLREPSSGEAEFLFRRSDLFIKPKGLLYVTPYGFNMPRAIVRRGALDDPVIEEVG